jgi:methionine-rich copper-binding protein CopC
MLRLSSCLFAALLCCTAGSAFAHAHLKTEAPAHDSIVKVAPTVLRLDFSEALELALSNVKLSDTKGNHIETAVTKLAADNGKTLLVPLTTPLAAGVYKVEWQVLSKDGHKTNGSYTFTVQPE